MRGIKWMSVGLMVAAVGCSAAPGLGGQAAVGRQAAQVAPAATTAPAAAGVANESKAAKPAAAALAPGAAPAPATGAPSAPRDSAQSTTGAYGTTAATDRPWDRMIIRNGTLGMHVENVERALAAARQMAGKHGGFVSASNTRIDKVGDREQMSATVTMQVRAEAFDAAISDLRGLAVKVESEVGTSQDVTEEYVDLDANLRNLQKTEATLVSLMEKATKLEDVLVLQRELTNVRSQIERIQGRKKFLERRSDMSQISLNLTQAPANGVAPVSAGAWDPAATAYKGWAASLRLLRTVAEVAILAVAFGWWLIPFAAVAGVIFLRRRPQPAQPA